MACVWWWLQIRLAYSMRRRIIQSMCPNNSIHKLSGVCVCAFHNEHSGGTHHRRHINATTGCYLSYIIYVPWTTTSDTRSRTYGGFDNVSSAKEAYDSVMMGGRQRTTRGATALMLMADAVVFVVQIFCAAEFFSLKIELWFARAGWQNGMWYVGNAIWRDGARACRI